MPKTKQQLFEQKMKILLLVLGAKLYAIRKKQKKSLKTVATAIRMSPALLSRMEKGLYDFPAYRLPQLCNYYQITLKEIISKI